MVTAKYERAGKPVLPKWWTDKVWPLLDGQNYRKLAAQASELAGRESPWGGDAITKFRQGSAVTRELTNAISMVLGVACPYWEAETETEALEFALVRARRSQLTDEKPTPETKRRRSEIAAALEVQQLAAEGQTDSVGWTNERSSRGPGPRRASGRRKASAGSRS